MTRLRSAGSVLGLFTAIALIAACSGASPDSDFAKPGSGDPSADQGSSDPGPTLGGNNDAGTASTADASSSACATTTAAAEGIPIYLVFMFDRSGSMLADSKWDSCVAGLDTFFSDPGSAGIHASMQVFPYNSGECSIGTYQKPLVDVIALPDTANAFSTALSNSGPQPDYNTPTLPALQGALAFAQQVQTGFKNGEKVAVVLVTDGDPNDCNSSAISVAAAAAIVAQTIPTYVIGVGPETTKLDIVAAGGGTAPAIIVSTSDPSKITADFESAISAIKGKALTCEYKMPAAPAGQTLDINSVNVQFTPGTGAAQTLSYNKDCGTGGQGWRYDDPANPTKIEICDSSCTTLKGDLAGKLDIVLGCHTEGVGPGGVAK